MQLNMTSHFSQGG